MGELGIYEYMIADWISNKSDIEVLETVKELVKLIKVKKNIDIRWSVKPRE